MTDREKLIQIIDSSRTYVADKENLADHLLANGVTFQKWIPVSERLPWEDIRVLVWLRRHDYGPIRIDTDRVHNNRWVRWNGCVTHWMPLPEPPKEK